jgi:HlyD family secretion protein
MKNLSDRNGHKLMKNITGKTNIKKLFIIIGLVLAFIVILSFFISGGNSGSKGDALNTRLFTAVKSDLKISVTENGDIMALNSKDIKCKVEGRSTIIKIVDEGTIIKPEDVNEMTLVELDSSEIKTRLNQHEASFLSTEASYADAKEGLAIQIKQNESDIQADQTRVRFGLMDLKKYLGEEIVDDFIADINDINDISAEIAKMVDNPKLGGEASQKLKQYKDEIYLAEAKYTRAEDKLEWTEKLAKKEYVSKNELKSDRLDVQSHEIQKKKAELTLELFKLYEFPKEAEKLYRDHEESKRKLDRTLAQTRSRLAQKKAKLKSSESTYFLQKERLEKLQKQLGACIIKAPAPGQVVYSSSSDNWRRRNQPIEEGAEVYERQTIINIPDPSVMKVEVKIPETWIDKVQTGQEAMINITAFPDRQFTGKVLKKAPLADQDRWLSPDLKVYRTGVSIEGSYDSLKTGMTAKVEIIIEILKDVINIPIQCVISAEDEKFCYVMTGTGRKKRKVTTGAFNDNFVEIKIGLESGEKVLLNPPREYEKKEDKK